jgi:hypothetical protein
MAEKILLDLGVDGRRIVNGSNVNRFGGCGLE